MFYKNRRGTDLQENRDRFTRKQGQIYKKAETDLQESIEQRDRFARFLRLQQ